MTVSSQGLTPRTTPTAAVLPVVSSLEPINASSSGLRTSIRLENDFFSIYTSMVLAQGHTKLSSWFLLGHLCHQNGNALTFQE